MSSSSRSSSSSSFTAGDLVLERIAARLQTLAATVGTARRPQRVHWSDPLMADGTLVVRQGQHRPLYEGSGDLVSEQDFEILVAAAAADSSGATIETRIDALLTDLIEALAADPTCGGNAMYAGLSFRGIEPLDDPEGRLAGEILQVTVTYSNHDDDFATKGIR